MEKSSNVRRMYVPKPKFKMHSHHMWEWYHLSPLKVLVGEVPAKLFLHELGLPANTSNLIAARALLFELMLLSRYPEKHGWVGISRRSEWYANQRAGRHGPHVSCRAMVRIIDAAAAAGLIEMRKGRWSRDPKKHVRTLVRPTPALQEVLTLAETGSAPDILQPIDLIELKDSEKRRIPLKPTKAVRKMQAALKEINETIVAYEWLVHREGEPPEQIHAAFARFKRVFNNADLKQGGRFYNRMQSWLKKAERSLLTVNGETTSELDYQSMQPRLVYNVAAGIPVPWDDAYMIPVPGITLEEGRPLMKLVALIALNVQSRRAALSALAKHIRDERIQLPDGVTAGTLLRAFEQFHQPVAVHFYRGIGLGMQFVDSEIAEQVLLRLARAGVPCLCIHDSFVVPDSKREFLKQVMHEEYKKRTGFECRVRVETGRVK